MIRWLRKKGETGEGSPPIADSKPGKREVSLEFVSAP